MDLEQHYQDILKLTLSQVKDEIDSLLAKRLIMMSIRQSIATNCYRVLYDQQKIIGFVRWEWSTPITILKGFLIDDAYRQQGYTQQLWDLFINESRRKNHTTVISYADKDDFVNISFHQHLGFQMNRLINDEKCMWVYHIHQKSDQSIVKGDSFWLNQYDVDEEL